MSALGQEQTCAAYKLMSALDQKADIVRRGALKKVRAFFKIAFTFQRYPSPCTHLIGMVALSDISRPHQWKNKPLMLLHPERGENVKPDSDAEHFHETEL